MTYLTKFETDIVTSGDIKTSGELKVGNPGSQKEAIFGEGGAYYEDLDGNQKLWIYNYDDSAVSGAKFSAEITTRATTMLAAQDDALYYGAVNLFWAMRATVGVAKTAEALVLEYWDGAAWQTFTGMDIEYDNNLGHSADNYFETTGKNYIIMQNGLDVAANAWTADDNILDELPNVGQDLYWVRIRNSVAVATPAQLTDLKIKGDVFEASDQDKAVLWGKFRQLVVNAREQGNFNTGIAAPSNNDIPISSNITLEGANNSFDNNALDELKFQFVLPENVDTSSSLMFEIYWFSTATTGNVEWELAYSFNTDTDVMDGTLSETSKQIIQTVSGTASTLQKSEFEIDISARTPGDTVNMLFFRDARPGNADDTMASDAIMKEVHLEFYIWKI